MPPARSIFDRFRRDPLAFIVGLCALAGPPISYGLAVQTDRATTAIRLDEQQKQLNTHDAGISTIIAALSEIRANTAYIRGRIDAIAMPTPADAHP